MVAAQINRMIPPKKQPFPKKGKSLKKAKKSKELTFSKQKQMLSPEIYKKLRENDSFPQIREQSLPFLPTYAA
jgi:hypothetical protein